MLGHGLSSVVNQYVQFKSFRDYLEMIKMGNRRGYSLFLKIV